MNLIKLKRIKNRSLLLIQKLLQKKDSADIFNNIYKNHLWGKSKNSSNFYSGEGSHDIKLTEAYIKSVSKFLSSIDAPKVLDLGCGDFEIGKKIASFASEYIACDVSSLVINQNKEKFKDLLNVKFMQLDGCQDILPESDIVIIRQVLQHLSNDDIKKVLTNIQSSGAQYLCITEHLPMNDNFIPNIDKPTGVGIRLSLCSGIDIEKHPFNFNSKLTSILNSSDNIAEGLNSRLVTSLYAL